MPSVGQFAGITREIYVEPLAGHLRHPLAHGVCKQLPNEVLNILQHITKHVNEYCRHNAYMYPLRIQIPMQFQ